MVEHEPISLYAIFHLNLAFSSIDEAHHHDVITRCYWPLLQLIDEHNIPLGIELTAYTLEKIHACDPVWVTTFATLLADKKCELLASGDSQIIGPLVPAKVNHANLLLGQSTYQTLLNITPHIAYINEQAVSAGLLDVYLDCGFEAVVVEWDNPFSHNPEWSASRLDRPQSLTTATGREIKVIWNNAIAFQKLQRYAHGELVLEDYVSYLSKHTSSSIECFSIYGSDAEVFDYRPGRYNTEGCHRHQEWQRITELFTHLAQIPYYQWVSPQGILEKWQINTPLQIATSAHPISVKKQAKYNITRWATSGRNDLLLNSYCYAQYQQLESKAVDNEQWRPLCRLWASDLRTHLTEARYKDLALPTNTNVDCQHNVQAGLKKQRNSNQYFSVTHAQDRNKLHIHSKYIQLTLNANRGLSIESLAFQQHNFVPVCGTLAHGHFQHIRYGADFYSNHLVMERFRERDRVADLNKSEFSYYAEGNVLFIETAIKTVQGTLHKSYRLEGECLKCAFSFESSDRPEASLRLGYITLLNCKQRPWFACHNGGDTREHFYVDEDIDHGAPVSSIVSASSALGATTGEFIFGSENNGVTLQWDPAECTALPMVSSQAVNDSFLNRCWFSLIEADETLKPGGHLPAFNFTISPSHNPGVEPK